MYMHFSGKGRKGEREGGRKGEERVKDGWGGGRDTLP